LDFLSTPILDLIAQVQEKGTKHENAANLVANGRFQTWCPLECSMFGCLWKEKEKHHFHFFPLFTPKDLI
jgi:hypothetical protein